MRQYLVFILLTVVESLSIAQDTAKPWTYWWWMGSAVNEKNIEIQLKEFSKAGLGGVHIIPIYGVKGYEQKFTPFLSGRWTALLDFTVRVAKREGLGVDMTTGTGWPFGGPNVSHDNTSKKFIVDGNQFRIEPVGQKVKRAAPGGAGFVADPFSRGAMNKYLERFDSTFANNNHGVRAMYSDSYEVYGANWTERFAEEFERRRGYKLQEHIYELIDTAGSMSGMLVKIDYNQTVAELLRETMKVWTDWSSSRKFITRYQAHGSPGNLLDLYSLASVPETESFGSSKFPIPGLRIDQTYNEASFGRPNPLAMKFASSAAHLTGRKLVSSETATWLADHFTVALSQVKPQVDELFAAGINHVFYHGIPYSPKEEKYPGWLFYASTNFGPTSAFWKYLPQLNSYIERCQKILQGGSPDNDIILYFPIADIWKSEGRSGGKVHQLDVHHTEKWLMNTPFGNAAAALADNGFAFDYVSDDQLQKFSINNASISNGVSSYKVLVVPQCEFIPVETLERIAALASNGGRVIFLREVPGKATGFANNKSNNDRLSAIKESLLSLKNVSIVSDIKQIDSVPREPWASHDIRFIRKKGGNGNFYFVTNLGATQFNQFIDLSSKPTAIRLFDPANNQDRSAVVNDAGQFYLSLAPGQSCFIFDNKKSNEGSARAISSTPLRGEWNVTFGQGNPHIELSRNVDELNSWTTWCDSCAYFSGQVQYSKTFDVPAGFDLKETLKLKFENISDVAEVSINGKPVGTAWCLPFEVLVPGSLLKPRGNLLEVRVSNAASNYFRLYDQRNPGWKKFYDINFVNIEYKPYNGANVKPLAAGLLGSVTLEYTNLNNR